MWQYHYVHRDCEQQVNAHNYQLLLVQLGSLRPIAANFRDAAGSVLHVVKISVRIWRIHLHSSGIRC